jgi:uncharacterized protein YidB (DUF937 family)
MGMFDVLGGNRRSGMSPLALAVLGTIAYKALKSKGGLGGMFGSAQSASSGTAGTGTTTADARAGMVPGEATPAGDGGRMNPSATSGAAAGGSGGLLGGLGGGGLGSGLRDLLDRFREGGHEDKAQSWVSTGQNRPIAANELEQVLGAERIEWLMQQTGLPKDQLLAGLSKELPGAIDKLTPKGQLPTDDELENEIRH